MRQFTPRGIPTRATVGATPRLPNSGLSFASAGLQVSGSPGPRVCAPSPVGALIAERAAAQAELEAVRAERDYARAEIARLKASQGAAPIPSPRGNDMSMQVGGTVLPSASGGTLAHQASGGCLGVQYRAEATRSVPKLPLGQLSQQLSALKLSPAPGTSSGNTHGVQSPTATPRDAFIYSGPALSARTQRDTTQLQPSQFRPVRAAEPRASSLVSPRQVPVQVASVTSLGVNSQEPVCRPTSSPRVDVQVSPMQMPMLLQDSPQMARRSVRSVSPRRPVDFSTETLTRSLSARRASTAQLRGGIMEAALSPRRSLQSVMASQAYSVPVASSDNVRVPFHMQAHSVGHANVVSSQKGPTDPVDALHAILARAPTPQRTRRLSEVPAKSPRNSRASPGLRPSSRGGSLVTVGAGVGASCSSPALAGLEADPGLAASRVAFELMAAEQESLARAPPVAHRTSQPRFADGEKEMQGKMSGLSAATTATPGSAGVSAATSASGGTGLSVTSLALDASMALGRGVGGVMDVLPEEVVGIDISQAVCPADIPQADCQFSAEAACQLSHQSSSGTFERIAAEWAKALDDQWAAAWACLPQEIAQSAEDAAASAARQATPQGGAGWERSTPELPQEPDVSQDTPHHGMDKCASASDSTFMPLGASAVSPHPGYESKVSLHDRSPANRLATLRRTHSGLTTTSPAVVLSQAWSEKKLPTPTTRNELMLQLEEVLAEAATNEPEAACEKEDVLTMSLQSSAASGSCQDWRNVLKQLEEARSQMEAKHVSPTFESLWAAAQAVAFFQDKIDQVVKGCKQAADLRLPQVPVLRGAKDDEQQKGRPAARLCLFGSGSSLS